jgi:hypothetical protein
VKWPSDVPRPDRITSRPEWPNKDILIIPKGIFYNFTKSIDTLCDDGQYHYVRTQDFRHDNDFVADLRTIDSATNGQFWKKLAVEISVDIMEFSIYKEITGVSRILKFIKKLEPVFEDNVENLHINIFLPAAQDLDTPATGVSFYKTSSIRTLRRLADKLKKFRSARSCIVILQVPPPPKRNLDTRWLSHAIPFKRLPFERILRWQIPSSPSMLLCEYDNKYIGHMANSIHAAISWKVYVKNIGWRSRWAKVTVEATEEPDPRTDAGAPL